MSVEDGFECECECECECEGWIWGLMGFVWGGEGEEGSEGGGGEKGGCEGGGCGGWDGMG